MSGLKVLGDFVREVYTEGATKRCPPEDSVQEIPIAQSEKNKQHQRINEHQEGAGEDCSEAWPELKQTPAQWVPPSGCPIVDKIVKPTDIKSCMPDWSVGQVSIADSVDRNCPVPEEEQRGWFQKHIEPINEIVREANQNFSMSEQSIISDQGSHDDIVNVSMELENIRDIGFEAHEQEKKTIERHFNSMLLSRLRAGRGLPYDPTKLTRTDGRWGKVNMSGYDRALKQFVYKVYKHKKTLE